MIDKDEIIKASDIVDELNSKQPLISTIEENINVNYSEFKYILPALNVGEMKMFNGTFIFTGGGIAGYNCHIYSPEEGSYLIFSKDLLETGKTKSVYNDTGSLTSYNVKEEKQIFLCKTSTELTIVAKLVNSEFKALYYRIS